MDVGCLTCRFTLFSSGRAPGGESPFSNIYEGSLRAPGGGRVGRRLWRRIGVGQLIGPKIGQVHVSVGVVILAEAARHKPLSRAVVAGVKAPVILRWDPGYGAG